MDTRYSFLIFCCTRTRGDERQHRCKQSSCVKLYTTDLQFTTFSGYKLWGLLGNQFTIYLRCQFRSWKGILHNTTPIASDSLLNNHTLQSCNNSVLKFLINSNIRLNRLVQKSTIYNNCYRFYVQTFLGKWSSEGNLLIRYAKWISSYKHDNEFELIFTCSRVKWCYTHSHGSIIAFNTRLRLFFALVS